MSKTVATQTTIADMLSKLAAEQRAQFETAAAAQDALGSISSLSTSHIWRAIALAIREGVCPAHLPWTKDAASLAALALHHVTRAMSGMNPSDEPSSSYRKAVFAADVLMGVLSLKATLETNPSGSSGILTALLLAIDLGESGAQLELAEAGRWDEVFRLKSKLGRPKGSTGSEWSRDLRPDIQAWIDQNPTARQADLVDHIQDMLDKWKPQKSLKLPPTDKSAVAKAVRKMKEAGLIVVPASFRWSR